MSSFHPEDRPDPSEQPIRARVPEHVAAGSFSTGVIVMTAQTEFILDFVQNLGRPHQITARVVMPHHVLPQLVDALQRNMELYRSRWGELPQMGYPAAQAGWEQAPANPNVEPSTPSSPPTAQNPTAQNPTAQNPTGQTPTPQSPTQPTVQNPGQPNRDMTPGPQSPQDSEQSQDESPGGGAQGPNPLPGSTVSDVFAAGPTPNVADTGNHAAGAGAPQGAGGQQSVPGTRQASAQEIYDDLKIKDELLSGSYANAVMIGHGPHEFSFDFITNFYPHSAVSSRVFLAAGQVPRLYDSLRGTWDQLRMRMQPPRGPMPPSTNDHEPPTSTDSPGSNDPFGDPPSGNSPGPFA